MERFQRISPSIVHCTYTPTDTIRPQAVVVDSACLEGQVIDACPIGIQNVRFLPREVWRAEPDGEPVIRVVKTVDGQRTYIDNLKAVCDRRAWRAEVTLRFAEDEHIFGLGQDENGVWDKRGRVEYLYQHNMKIPMPIFVSSKGYGVLFDCACLMVFDDREGPCRITLECVEQVDFYVVSGSMDEIIAGFRTLTGRASPMPDWALGYWQSKERYTCQRELLETASRYREEKVPLDVLVQDWKTWEGELWGDKYLDKSRYPDMGGGNDALHAMNVHTLVSVWPNMNAGGRDHREFAQAGLLLNDYSTYNAFSEEARRLYWKQAEEELYRGGFDGWWCDNTEPFSSPDWCGEVKLDEKTRYELVGGEHEKYLDAAYANGFSLAHARGIYENQPKKPVVNLTRSGWAGIQKYGAILWAGDTSATWQELRREIAKGMSMSLCGVPYWTVDAGAFFVGGASCWRRWSGNPEAAPVWFWHGDYDGGVADRGYQELYTRWLQFACFLPIFRSHGTDTPREFWNFDEPFRGIIKETIRLRYRLMPYIKQMAQQVTEMHFTMMRSLLFDFPEDETAWMVDDAYLFGRDLLICPVTQPMLYGANSTPMENAPEAKRCYLPKGTRWHDFWSNRVYEGGQYVSVPLCMEHIPVFVRDGAVIELQEDTQYAGQPAQVRQKVYA